MMSTLSITETGQGSDLVYQLFDAAGEVVYIGMTNSLERRLAEHEKERAWFHEVAVVRFERFPHRIYASQKEQELIRLHRPRHNIPTGRRSVLPQPAMSVATRLSCADVDALRNLANATGGTVSDLIRTIIETWLEGHSA